jgi:hypothetical protein
VLPDTDMDEPNGPNAPDEPPDEDELDVWVADSSDAEVVDGLAAVLTVCATLRERRLGLGFTLADVVDRCLCDAEAIEWVDEGDVASPVEALVYYAAAVGMRLELGVTRG